jgi:short-subunit dehydrogenase
MLRALVTGATSGLGYELARLYAAPGFRLILVGRNRRRLAQISREMRTAFGTSTVTAFCPGGQRRSFTGEPT